MRKLLLIIMAFSLISCASRPKGFTYYFNEGETGLDTLININGYYISDEGCQEPRYAAFMFYPNGLFVIGFGENYEDNDADCFAGKSKTNGCLSAPWGIYEIHNDTIKTQIYQDNGNWGHRFTIFRDYKIISKTELILINEYCIEKGINWCNENRKDRCPKVSIFLPLETKRGWRESPLMKKKWIWKK